MNTLSPTDPLLSRARELVDKHLDDCPTLWLKPPGDTPAHHRESRFWHPWYPEHYRLLRSGWTEYQGNSGWAQVVLFGGRQKEENRFLLERGRRLAGDSGKVLFVLPNDYGGRSFHKGLDGHLENFTGRKSRLFLLSPTPAVAPSPLFKLESNREGLACCPGLFSWERADRGSSLLLETLKSVKLEGPVADLGAGYGYLSRSLPKTLERHLMEADSRGVAACAENVKEGKVYTHWCDLTEPATLPKELFGRFRTVVMNPPFHTNKRSEPVLGGAFVAMARRLLNQGGELYLVGNSHLPYPKIVQSVLGGAEIVLQREGFQIVKGRKL